MIGLALGLSLSSQGGGAAAATPFDTGWISASTGSSVAISGDTGTIAWGTPTSIYASDDNRATIAGKTNGNTATLRALYDLSSLADGATITKISVQIEKEASGTGIVDQLLSLINADAQAQSDRVGPNKASASFWPGSDGSGTASEAYVLYEWTGADLDGITVAALKVKAGTHFRATKTSGGCGVDHMQIKVEGTA